MAVLECQSQHQATHKFDHGGGRRGPVIRGRGEERVTTNAEREANAYGTTSVSNLDVRASQLPSKPKLKPNFRVLSAFEESSAACISDMLRQVSNGAYLDAIRMAEKFILHVEVLFGTIDDLEFHFASLNMKG